MTGHEELIQCDQKLRLIEMISSSALSEEKSLPICQFIWVGLPSELNDKLEHAVTEHDIAGVINFATWAKNPVIFYCLEAHADHYKAKFKEKGFEKITVKSVEGLIQDAYDDECLKPYAEIFTTIFDTHLKNHTRKDFVLLKDLFSLLTTYRGGYTLDTNVQPLQPRSFSLTSYPYFMAPEIVSRFGEQGDVWMLYAPEKNQHVKNAILQFIEWWKEYKNSGIYDAVINNTSSLISRQNFWSFKKFGGKVPMEHLNLVKTYNNTHYSNRHWAEYAISDIEDHNYEEIIKMKFSNADFNEMFNSLIENKKINVINDLTKMNIPLNHLSTILSQEILQEYTDIGLAFHRFLDAEAKMHLTADNSELESLMKKVFLWSLECRLKEYIQFAEENTYPPELPEIIEKLYEDFRIKKENEILDQIIKNGIKGDEVKKSEAINSFINFPLSLASFKERILSSRTDNSLQFLLQHPLHKNISPMAIIMLQDSCRINRKFIDKLDQEKNKFPEQFSSFVKGLMLWAVECDSIGYLNYLIKELSYEDFIADIDLSQALSEKSFMKYDNYRHEIIEDCGCLNLDELLLNSPTQSLFPHSPKERAASQTVTNFYVPTDQVNVERPQEIACPKLFLSNSSLFAKRKLSQTKRKLENNESKNFGP